MGPSVGPPFPFAALSARGDGCSRVLVDYPPGWQVKVLLLLCFHDLFTSIGKDALSWRAHPQYNRLSFVAERQALIGSLNIADRVEEGVFPNQVG